MNDFIGGNNYNQTEDQAKTKKLMKLIIVIIVLLLIACIALVGVMYYLQSTQLKITMDGVAANKQLENVLLFDENGKVYIPIRTFATYMGYESSNGDYNQDRYTEDSTKCYVKCNNEVASFSLGSNKIYKTLLDGSNDYEYYEIDEPVKTINGQLYTTINGAKIAFNILMDYNQEQNQVTILTLPYLVNYYTAQFQNAGISEGDSFSNQKALLYNMIILKNAQNYYGVYDLNGNEIIGTKYTSIKFIESTKEFIVTTQENKMGIIAHDATTKINPEYDQIKQIDKNNGLYLVTNDNKQGVINSYGSIVVYIEYDQIGIDSSRFTINNIQNQYLLYDNCIPVKRNNLWGLFDKTGKQLTELQYENFGCTEGNTAVGATTYGVLLIPEYEGIVVRQQNLYGLIDSSGNDLLPIVLQAFYATVSSGQTTYSMLYGQQEINVITYIKENIKNIQNNQQNNNQTNSQDQNAQTNPENQNTVSNEQGNNEVPNQTTDTTNSEVNNQTSTDNGATTNGNAVQNGSTVPTSGEPVQGNSEMTSGAQSGNASSGVDEQTPITTPNM